MKNNNIETDSHDISKIIHTIEFIIPFRKIEFKTINQFRNSKEKNVIFKCFSSEDKQFSFVKIKIPDLSKCEITSFNQLKAYVLKVFMSLCVESDKQRMLESYVDGNVLITRIDVYNRLYYDMDQSYIEVFRELKVNSSLLQILIPNLRNICIKNKNSLYFNFKNKKSIDLYDEKELRSKESLKLEYRIEGSENLKRAFKLGIEDGDGLKIKNWNKIQLEPLIQYYNNWINKIIRSIPSKRKSNTLKHSSGVNELMTHFNVTDYEKLDEGLKKQDKEDKQKKKQEMQWAFRMAFKSIPELDIDINYWLKNNHLDIYKKIYPQYDDGQFLQRKIREFSIVHTFINFMERKYSFFLTTKYDKEEYIISKKENIPNVILGSLSSDEYSILFFHTRDIMNSLIREIREEYSTKRKKIELKEIDNNHRVLFKVFNTFSIDLTKLRKSISYVQNIQDDNVLLKSRVIAMFSEFRFSM